MNRVTDSVVVLTPNIKLLRRELVVGLLGKTTFAPPSVRITQAQEKSKSTSSDQSSKNCGNLEYKHKGTRPLIVLSLPRVSGGADRDRTGGLLVANQALSQLSYSPTLAVGS